MSNVSLKKVGNPQIVKTDSGAEILKEGLKCLLGVKGVKDVVAYITDGENNKNYRTGNEEMSVFIQAVPSEELIEEAEVTVDVMTESYVLKKINGKEIPDGIIKIKNEAGEVIAYASSRFKSIYIPLMFDGMDFDVIAKIISYIVGKINENYFEELENMDSWKKSKQKDELKERVEKYLRRGNEKLVKNAKRELEHAENTLIERQNSIKQYYDEVLRNRKKLEDASNQEVLGLDNFLVGLDTIADHTKVENLIVKEKFVEIHMVPLKIRANINGKDKFFELLGASMKINIDSAEVKFDSESKFKSHWTAKDPHPHVNGSSGNACLGNIANTIAELASEREIYALFLICLDFLENANTEDPAGRKVTNWKEIKDEPVVSEPTNPGVSVETFMVSTVFVEGGGYHTEVEMTEAQMAENNVKEYHGDYLMPDVYEKLMKVLGE